MRITGVKRMSTKYGLEVSVQHSIGVTQSYLHSVRLVGTCGGSKHSHTVTVGAMDGKRPHPPTANELQAMLDTYRTKVAEEAAWKESVRISFQSVS